MGPKRSREDEPSIQPFRKHHMPFKLGPDNLPDGAWRRKVIKIKKALIHKAKVKKSYAKIKAQEPPVDTIHPVGVLSSPSGELSQGLHPERQVMLDIPQEPIPNGQKRARKPSYFAKETAFAEQRKEEAEVRRLEFERRIKERGQKIEDRERYRKSMAKARAGGRNGQRKLGRESEVLLEKVRRIVSS